MAASDWVPLWTQGAVAAGTLALAGGTVYLGLKSRDEVSATETLAREAGTDRQLQWRPQLDLTLCWVDVGPAGGQFYWPRIAPGLMELHNSGAIQSLSTVRFGPFHQRDRRLSSVSGWDGANLRGSRTNVGSWLR